MGTPGQPSEWASASTSWGITPPRRRQGRRDMDGIIIANIRRLDANGPVLNCSPVSKQLPTGSAQFGDRDALGGRSRSQATMRGANLLGRRPPRSRRAEIGHELPELAAREQLGHDRRSRRDTPSGPASCGIDAAHRLCVSGREATVAMI